MPGLGRQILATTGSILQVIAGALEDVIWKPIGVTIDWSTVVAVSGSPVTLGDGNVIPVGAKYLRYGQVLGRITASGKFGPYDPVAADGRQTAGRGLTYVLNETVVQVPLFGLVQPDTDHVTEVFEGGPVYKVRLLATAGAHSLAAGPTYAELEAALPQLTYVQD